MEMDSYTAKLLLRAYAQGMSESVGVDIKVTDIHWDGLIDIIATKKDSGDLVAHTVCNSVVLARQFIHTIACNKDVLKALNYDESLRPEESLTVDDEETEDTQELDWSED